MLLAAVVQTVISAFPPGVVPMPVIMMSTVRPFRLRAFEQSDALKTSPWVMVRWVEMADSGTPRSERRAVSLDGVRTTGWKGSAGGVRPQGELGGEGRTSSAIVTGFESRY